MSFGAAPPFALGVEEELFLVDAATFEAAPVFEQVVPDQGPRLKPELFACLVETATPVCRDASEALAEIVRLRGEVRRRAQRLGATTLASGTHPRARGREQPIVTLPRYQRMQEELGDTVYTQLVCGLHVHVSMPDARTCLRTFEAVVPWLPVLLGLSANSPFLEGEASGLRSARAERLLLMPTGGTPPLLPGWAAWEEATQGDESRRHWDAWPRPVHGTLEVRIADQQTEARRSGGFVALVQALAAAVADQDPAPYDRTLYTRRRAAAARHAPDPEEVAALAALVEPSARTLGCWELAQEILTATPGAERQLETGRPGGLEEVVRDLVERSLPSQP